MNSTQTPYSNRVCDRYDCCFSIACSRFNSTQFFWGKMVNYSQYGLYFEADSAIQAGTSILIRVLKNLDADTAPEISEGFRSLALGEVKWCKELISEGMTYYGIGVRYYWPDY